MPQDTVLHDFAEFETKVRAEGIPRPTLHWIKDGKQVHLDENGVKAVFANTSEIQVTSDFSIEHFSGNHAGDVRSVIILMLSIANLVNLCLILNSTLQ